VDITAGGTFAGVAVLIVALLPGAIYTWAFERVVGRWGIGLSDRLYRFVGISALFHALIAPATYNIWRDYLRTGAPDRDRFPLWMWGVAFLYVAIPAALGTLMAVGLDKGWAWATAVAGRSPAPTAWDAVFSGDPAGVAILMKLKSGSWVGGQYAEGSYVGGYPEPADIYLIRELRVDQTTGDFVRNQQGEEIPVGKYGLLVRLSEVEYLEIAD